MRPYEAPDLSPGRDTSTLKLDTKLYSPSTALDRPSTPKEEGNNIWEEEKEEGNNICVWKHSGETNLSPASHEPCGLSGCARVCSHE